MANVMLKVNGGEDPHKAANDWIKQNKAQVDTWTKGIKHVHGQSIKLTYVAWDSEIASTNVVANVLRSLGYKVDIQPWKFSHCGRQSPQKPLTGWFVPGYQIPKASTIRTIRANLTIWRELEGRQGWTGCANVHEKYQFNF